MAYGVVNSGGGSNNTDSLESIKSLVEEVKTNTETIISDDNGLAEDHEELKKSHTAISAAIDAIKAVVDSIKLDTEAILGDTSEIKTGVSAIKTVVDTIKSTVNTIKTMISALSTNVDATKTAAEEASENTRDLRALDWTHFEGTATVYNGADEANYETVGTILEVEGEGELLDCFVRDGKVSNNSTTTSGRAILKVTVDGEVLLFSGPGSEGIINPNFITAGYCGSRSKCLYVSHGSESVAIYTEGSESDGYAYNGLASTPNSEYCGYARSYCIFEPLKFKSLKVEGCKRQEDEEVESTVFVNYRLS